MLRSIITGTGSYIPTQIKTNRDFARQRFYSGGRMLPNDSVSIVQKFEQITGIRERRYVAPELSAADIAYIAAAEAIKDSGVDPETIDQLIVAHNFGNVLPTGIQSVAVPSIANQVKHLLGIRNPSCIAYDLLFGCAGWVQGMIHADAFIKVGVAKKAIVIGAETLSRVIDRYDRDSMIFSDGAGAIVLEKGAPDAANQGILSYAAQTDSVEEVGLISMNPSDYTLSDPTIRYLKMNGRKVYEYALSKVPAAMKDCLDKSGESIHDLKKIFIHQANEKMDEAMVKRFYELYELPVPEGITPMTVHWLGNSSVATVPTLFDLVRKQKCLPHQLHKGDLVMFAAVGAGMNINAVCYRY